MVLSEQDLKRLKAFLAEPARNYCSDKYTDPYNKALAWAQDPEHGDLPPESARGFANWLSNVWDDWTEEDGITVERLLNGAVTAWCGGRVMPS